VPVGRLRGSERHRRLSRASDRANSVRVGARALGELKRLPSRGFLEHLFGLPLRTGLGAHNGASLGRFRR